MRRLEASAANLADASDIREGLARRTSLGDEIYETLLFQLISQKIPPGARIPVDALVREFGISQTPIRAALIRLEADGLVVKKHNSGYSAAPMPSSARFHEIYEFRLLLEPHATAKATDNITPEVLAKLQDLHQAMRQLSQNNAHFQYGKFAVIDSQFHALIVETCGNQLMADALERLYTHMHLFRLQYHNSVTEQAIEEHAAILAAMETGEPENAAQAMRAHIISSLERMQPFFTQPPPFEATK